MTSKNTTSETAKFVHVVFYIALFTNESHSESKECNFVFTFFIEKEKEDTG